ncbi:hypothetical protein TH25_01650 [Thalassospira profundimaris]|uniref:Uncharacterized protein n=1 Tax=Thalassospira profundimaris TaxID=502049 RepID=A0A367XK88_9PROT|nr:hypothetical protein TH25_01650 [Thalassospira profundimaris]
MMPGHIKNIAIFRHFASENLSLAKLTKGNLYICIYILDQKKAYGPAIHGRRSIDAGYAGYDIAITVPQTGPQPADGEKSWKRSN